MLKNAEQEGVPGLGLEAQRDAVLWFIGADGVLAHEFMEAESATGSRTGLTTPAALDHGRRPASALVSPVLRF